MCREIGTRRYSDHTASQTQSTSRRELRYKHMCICIIYIHTCIHIHSWRSLSGGIQSTSRRELKVASPSLPPSQRSTWRMSWRNSARTSLTGRSFHHRQQVLNLLALLVQTYSIDLLYYYKSRNTSSLRHSRCHPHDATRTMPPARCHPHDATRTMPPARCYGCSPAALPVDPFI